MHQMQYLRQLLPRGGGHRPVPRPEIRRATGATLPRERPATLPRPLYVHDRQASLVRPPKELKGFAKVALQPGENQTVTIALDFRAFAYYHPAYKQWITESGEFDLLIGASAADIRCKETVTGIDPGSA